jgi:hypothetical protein
LRGKTGAQDYCVFGTSTFFVKQKQYYFAKANFLKANPIVVEKE